MPTIGVNQYRISTEKGLVGPWVFGRIKKVWGPEGREAIGLLNPAGEVVAGVVFEDNTGRSVVGHVAISTKHTPLRKLIRAVFYYVFVDLGVEKFVGFVNSSNKAALTLDLKLGFRPEAVIEGIYPDGDMVLFVMNRRECIWIPHQYREQREVSHG